MEPTIVCWGSMEIMKKWKLLFRTKALNLLSTDCMQRRTCGSTAQYSHYIFLFRSSDLRPLMVYDGLANS